jgi:hypothetical protein
VAQYDDRSFAPVARSFTAKADAHMVTLAVDSAKACHQFRFDAKALPAWIQYPQVNDPLNVFVCPVLTALASEDGSSCVVIDVSDVLWHLAVFSEMDASVNLDEFKVLMTKWAHYEHLFVGDSSIWRPKYFDESEAKLADRKALARYAKAFAATGSKDWVAQCRMYREAGASVGPLSKQFAALSSGKWQGEMTPSTDCMCRLIGAISRVESVLPILELPPNFRLSCVRIKFNRRAQEC